MGKYSRAIDEAGGTAHRQMTASTGATLR